MTKIVAVIVSFFALLAVSACSGTTSSDVPTVTVTAQPTQEAPPEIIESPQEKFVSYVRQVGGRYASIAGDSQLINLGNIVCDGYSKGLSQDDVVSALSYALVENNMNNEDGALFAAALIVGAERYLCSQYV